MDEKPVVEIVKPIEIKIDEISDKKIENTSSENDGEITEVKDKENDEDSEADKENKTNENEANDAHKNGESELDEVSKVIKKRKRSNSGSSSSSSSSSDSDEEETVVEKIEEPKSPEQEKKDVEFKKVDDESSKMEDGEEEEESNEKMDTSTEKPKEDDVSIEIPDDEEKKANDADEEKEDGNKENKTKADEEEEETIDLDKEKDPKEDGPKALHKTSSIFLRNLAPTITKSEVESMCKKYNGFLRVAIADPLVERRWFRRGWVTFRRDVNIKEICWKLNNIRLRDCELGAIVNRDLSRRVRPVNGITTHKTIVRSDIKLCAKVNLYLIFF